MSADKADPELLAQTEDCDESLSANPLWEDVTPIAQNDGRDTVINISYMPLFKEAMDFFRAVLSSQELSPRVLALTKRVIEFNAANYTAWHVRRECLYALNADLKDELKYVAECAENNPKNYQVWYHRRALVEKLGDGAAEPQFVAQILNDTDAKNYLAWAHRQWAVETFSLWEGELQFTDYLLKEDVRNNSAWNHRWFVVTRASSLEKLADSDARREIDYAKGKAELALSNECPYNYIRAITSRSTIKLSDDDVFLWMLKSMNSGDSNMVSLRSLLIDAYVEQGDKQRAVQLCMELANRFDIVRREYWRWRANVVAESHPS